MGADSSSIRVRDNDGINLSDWAFLLRKCDVDGQCATKRGNARGVFDTYRFQADRRSVWVVHECRWYRVSRDKYTNMDYK